MYRNVFWDSKNRQIILSTWNKNGDRIRIATSFKPYIYVESASGEAESIFGNRLTKKEFDTPYDRSQYIKNSGIKRIYENFDITQQFLLDLFWQKVGDDDFAKNDLRIIFFDIEVDPLPDGEFPKPEDVKAEINIITCWDSLDKKYHVFSKNRYTGNNLPDDAEYDYVPSERGLLLHFLDYWKSNNYPDIVAGWNSNGFDFPYTFNRIIKVLGEEAYNSLSPHDMVDTRIVKDKMFRDVIKYDIKGVTLLDWMDVYVKFKVTKQESMKLDFIANKELGTGKVDYKGMTIYEFMEKEWNRFVEYNIQDVRLLVLLEKKLQYFRILRTVSNLACLNYDKGLMTIPVTNGAIAVRARGRGQKLNTFIRDIDTSIEKGGGFVSSVPGFHTDIMTVDASSLYPSIIRSNNLSPETKVGMVYSESQADVFSGEDDDPLLLKLVNGRQYRLTRKKLKELIKAKDLVYSANGCLTRQNVEGLFPQFMREIYTQRKADKKQMEVIKKENKGLEAELEELKKKLKEMS